MALYFLYAQYAYLWKHMALTKKECIEWKLLHILQSYTQASLEKKNFNAKKWQFGTFPSFQFYTFDTPTPLLMTLFMNGPWCHSIRVLHFSGRICGNTSPERHKLDYIRYDVRVYEIFTLGSNSTISSKKITFGSKSLLQ